jgi:hypothetical protein
MPDHKRFFKNQLNLVKLFVQGELTEEDYFEKRRKFGHQTKWKEMKFVAKDLSLWYSFLLKLKAHQRLKALIEVQELTRAQVRLMATNISGGGVDVYFSERKENTRGITNSQLELAIIMDTPAELLIYDGDKNHYLTPHKNSFMEYIVIAELTNLQKLASFTLNEPENRIIRGYRLDNTSGVINSVHNEVMVRVDKRKKFFALQFYFDTSSSQIDFSLINSLVNIHWSNQIKNILIGKAHLRCSYVLTLFGTYIGNSELPDGYLQYVKDFKEIHKAAEIKYPNNGV